MIDYTMGRGSDDAVLQIAVIHQLYLADLCPAFCSNISPIICKLQHSRNSYQSSDIDAGMQHLPGKQHISYSLIFPNNVALPIMLVRSALLLSLTILVRVKRTKTRSEKMMVHASSSAIVGAMYSRAYQPSLSVVDSIIHPDTASQAFPSLFARAQEASPLYKCISTL